MLLCGEWRVLSDLTGNAQKQLAAPGRCAFTKYLPKQRCLYMLAD